MYGSSRNTILRSPPDFGPAFANWERTHFPEKFKNEKKPKKEKLEVSKLFKRFISGRW